MKKLNGFNESFKAREDPICNDCVNETHKFHKEIFWWVDEDAVAEIRKCRCMKCLTNSSDERYYQRMTDAGMGRDYSRIKKMIK